jgi:hypothetical protein
MTVGCVNVVVSAAEASSTVMVVALLLRSSKIRARSEGLASESVVIVKLTAVSTRSCSQRRIVPELGATVIVSITIVSGLTLSAFATAFVNVVPNAARASLVTSAVAMSTPVTVIPSRTVSRLSELPALSPAHIPAHHTVGQSRGRLKKHTKECRRTVAAFVEDFILVQIAPFDAMVRFGGRNT